jgi:hypothetical protein
MVLNFLSKFNILSIYILQPKGLPYYFMLHTNNCTWCVINFFDNYSFQFCCFISTWLLYLYTPNDTKLLSITHTKKCWKLKKVLNKVRSFVKDIAQFATKVGRFQKSLNMQKCGQLQSIDSP